MRYFISVSNHYECTKTICKLIIIETTCFRRSGRNGWKVLRMYYPIRWSGWQDNWFWGTCCREELVKKTSTKQVDVISDSKKLDVDGNDTKRDPIVATHTTYKISTTHTTNGISTHKLLINPTIQVVVRPINILVTASVVVLWESMSPCQMVLPWANITEAACSCARIYWNPGKISDMERDGATPRDSSSSKTNFRLSL